MTQKKKAELETDLIELARVIDSLLPLLAHKGFHGRKTYDNPRADTVERAMWELAAERGCSTCTLLLDLEKRKIIRITPTNRLQAVV